MADVGYLAGVPLKSKGGEWGLLFFSIDGGSGTPAISQDYEGAVASVADTATGKITVTLADKWAVLHPVSANVDAADGLDKAELVCTAPQTVLILVETGGALADTPGIIHCCVAVRRNTSGTT